MTPREVKLLKLIELVGEDHARAQDRYQGSAYVRCGKEHANKDDAFNVGYWYAQMNETSVFLQLLQDLMATADAVTPPAPEPVRTDSKTFKRIK